MDYQEFIDQNYLTVERNRLILEGVTDLVLHNAVSIRLRADIGSPAYVRSADLILKLRSKDV